MSNAANVCVIQMGARLHYAAPAALARYDRLSALVTDATNVSAGGMFDSVISSRLVPKAIARLKGRHVPEDIPRDRVHSFVTPSFQIAAVERFGPRVAKSARTLHRFGIGGNLLAKIAIKQNFFGADMLYVHPCSTTDAVRTAKQRGLKVVIEAISHPFNKRVELDEFSRYRIPPDQSSVLVEDNIAFFKNEAEMADVILAASPYVRDGLITLGLPANRIEIVRYGIDAAFFEGFTPAPVHGRILYVGAVNYLKGVPTLAAAAKMFADSSQISFNVVGPLAPRIAGRPEFEGPTYLGQVPRSVVRRHFAEADVFAFPSLSDGFGLVLLEAMAAGLPVVSTANCADLVQHGENGFVVPERDPIALADAIITIVADRDLRSRMSEAARKTAARHTIEDYADALTRAVGVP